MTHENLVISAYLIPHIFDWPKKKTIFTEAYIDFYTIFNNMVFIVVKQEMQFW